MNKTNTKSYYAAQSPRGFANENVIHRFPSKAQRDAWVAEHCDDGDLNSAACGAKAITAREARDILRRKDDDLTTQYNSLVEHESE